MNLQAVTFQCRELQNANTILCVLRNIPETNTSNVTQNKVTRQTQFHMVDVRTDNFCYWFLGPTPLSISELMMQIFLYSRCSDIKNNDHVRPQFCTCHDSSAQQTCDLMAFSKLSKQKKMFLQNFNPDLIIPLYDGLAATGHMGNIGLLVPYHVSTRELTVLIF